MAMSSRRLWTAVIFLVGATACVEAAMQAPGRITVPPRVASVNPDAEVTKPPPVIVRDVRLEPADPIESAPSVNLTFEIENTGDRYVTDIVLDISLVQRANENDEATSPKTVLAGPFTIRAKNVLHPGHTMTYAVRMRHVSVDCSCSGRVRVVAARISLKSHTIVEKL